MTINELGEIIDKWQKEDPENRPIFVIASEYKRSEHSLMTVSAGKITQKIEIMYETMENETTDIKAVLLTTLDIYKKIKKEKEAES